MDITIKYYDDKATVVEIRGSMNDWQSVLMTKINNDGCWTYDTKLNFGSYEYKFIVDGVWKSDETQPTVTTDGISKNLIVIDYNYKLICDLQKENLELKELIIDHNLYKKIMFCFDELMQFGCISIRSDDGSYLKFSNDLAEKHPKTHSKMSRRIITKEKRYFNAEYIGLIELSGRGDVIDVMAIKYKLWMFYDKLLKISKNNSKKIDERYPFLINVAIHTTREFCVEPPTNIQIELEEWWNE